ncbi:MAG: GMC family oxidoreductase N-terminal domain-containing protein [Actinomycetota bacterium]|nr:GMC family oxidoreductase N-terminal domain-containing protein [Actinomycetota bacterium]
MPDSHVDYVVVGAGTAGCVLAARLSVDPQCSVALLELGGMDTNPAIYTPGLDPMYSLWAPQGAENWGYATVPQSGLGGRSIDIARGKVLGGSSTINAMVYIRGNYRNFDTWAQLGNRGWSYVEVLPYFKKSETYHGPLSQYHGDNGPMPVIDLQKPSVVSHAFVEAAAELGATQKYNDFNGASQEAGAGFYQSTRTVDGIRATAGSAFVKPILGRKNLQLLSQVRATRLIIEQDRARGVEYAGPDGVTTIRAEREVVVCCGAFETPKLMMLSGLGPAEQLATHDIPVVQDLPGVGQNLMDHLLVGGVAFESLVPLDPPELLAEGGLFLWSGTQTDQVSPDLQYFFGPVQYVAPEYLTDGPGFTFAPILTQPRSRGTVTLTSSDPTALARIDPQYLSRDEDLAVLEYGIRYARELVHTSAFDKLRGRELAPGEAVTSTSELRDYIRRVCGTVWHPVGTCRMGTDREAVVDDQLRVHGVAGLRIVDASVMPELVNGNSNAAVMMIAEKAADVIRGDNLPSASGSRWSDQTSAHTTAVGQS